jgi:hypothetical protein
MKTIGENMTNNQGFSLLWKPDVERVIERHHDWFGGKRKYLVTIIPITWNGYNWDLHIDIHTERPLEEYDFTDEEQLFGFLAYRLRQIEQSYWVAKAEWGMEDDYIPVFEPRIGWAEVVAPFVKEPRIKYYAQTSQLEPIIQDYETFDWNQIGFNPENQGNQILTKMNQWCKEMGKGRFLVQPRGLDANPSDVAKALRGDHLFTDFIERPDDVDHLLSVTTQMVIELIEYQRHIIGGPTLGGYGTAWHGGYWTPGTVIGHLGDNVSDLISGAMFDRFILPHLQKMVAHFGGCVFARDVTTKQIWGSLRKLGNVLAFKPRNMGRYKVTIDDIRSICDKTNNLPLFIQTFSWDEFQNMFKVAQELNIRAFFVCQCQDREEGFRIIDIIRSAT